MCGLPGLVALMCTSRFQVCEGRMSCVGSHLGKRLKCSGGRVAAHLMQSYSMPAGKYRARFNTGSALHTGTSNQSVTARCVWHTQLMHHKGHRMAPN